MSVAHREAILFFSSVMLWSETPDGPSILCKMRLISEWGSEGPCFVWDIQKVYDPGCSPSWWMFHVHLKRMCILLLLGRVFCKCQSDAVVDGGALFFISLLGFHPWILVCEVCNISFDGPEVSLDFLSISEYNILVLILKWDFLASQVRDQQLGTSGIVGQIVWFEESWSLPPNTHIWTVSVQTYHKLLLWISLD